MSLISFCETAFTNTFSISGKAGRRTFLKAHLIALAVTLVATLPFAIQTTQILTKAMSYGFEAAQIMVEGSEFNVFFLDYVLLWNWIVIVALQLCVTGLLAVGVRRLNDIGLPGITILLALIPLANFFLVIGLFVLPGNLLAKPERAA